MNMKKIFKSLLLIASVALAISCADDSLDPLNINKVKKGTILALRGQQLQNIYFTGIPGSEFFPRQITGDETFDFDAELLSEDPGALESFDIFVIKRTKVGTAVTTSRVLLTNIPFSEFQETSDYPNPWVSVSLNLTDILDKLELDYTNPDDVATILDVYKFGIGIESDLNLTDGSVVPAAEIVAAGLFQSNQFYPAQKLTYTVTDYCTYEAAAWLGLFEASEARSTVYGPYDITLAQDPTDPNQFILSNFYDCGETTRYVKFTASTNAGNQIVEFPSQTTAEGTVSGTGVYNQCLGTFSIDVKYVYTDASCNGSAGTDNFRYDFKKK